MSAFGTRHRRPTTIHSGSDQDDASGSGHSQDDDEVGNEFPRAESDGGGGAGVPPVSDAPPPVPPPVIEEKQCRICFAGEEDEEENGRLFRPCRCKGSMKYVHVECLDRWRKMSSSSSAFWACSQCGYKYALARTRAVGLAKSPVILGTTTLILFTVIVFLSSFITTWWLPDLSPSATAPKFIVEEEPPTGWFSDYISTASGSSYIRHAVQALNEVVFDDAFPLPPPDPDFGLVEKWIWQLTSSPVEIKRERIKRRTAAKLGRPKERQSSADHTWIASFVQRFILGLAFVGVISFMNLLASAGVYGPLQIIRQGRRLFGARQQRDRANGGVDLGTALVLVLLVVGLVRAMWKIYQLNVYLASRLLTRAETAILEVHENGDIDEDAQRRREQSLPARIWSDLASLVLAQWRAIQRAFGDPLEPWYRKLVRVVYRGTVWAALKTYEWWYRFGVDMFG